MYMYCIQKLHHFVGLGQLMNVVCKRPLTQADQQEESIPSSNKL